jgi:hypothetical protein
MIVYPQTKVVRYKTSLIWSRSKNELFQNKH